MKRIKWFLFAMAIVAMVPVQLNAANVKNRLALPEWISYFPQDASLFSAVVSANDRLIAVGRVTDNTFRAFIAAYDKTSGALLDYHCFEPEKLWSDFTGITVTPDGNGYMVVGYGNKTNENPAPIVAYYNQDLENEWWNIYPFDTQSVNRSWAYDIIKSPNNGYVLCGDLLPTRPGIISLGFALEIDADGVLLGKHFYEPDSDHTGVECRTLISTGDGYFLAGSSHRPYAKDMWGVKTDYSFRPDWSFLYALPTQNVVLLANDLARDPAGKIIIGGTAFYNTIPFRRNPLIMQLDHKGTVEWKDNQTNYPFLAGQAVALGPNGERMLFAAAAAFGTYVGMFSPAGTLLSFVNLLDGNYSTYEGCYQKGEGIYLAGSYFRSPKPAFVARFDLKNICSQTAPPKALLSPY